MWRLGPLRIGNRKFDVHLHPRQPTRVSSTGAEVRGQLCFVAVETDPCRDVQTLRERFAGGCADGARSDWLLIRGSKSGAVSTLDEAVTRNSVLSILARNGLAVVVFDSREMNRPELLDIDRFRIGSPRTRWLVFDVGLTSRFVGSADREGAAFTYGGAVTGPRIRSVVDTLIVALQTGITKQSSLAEYSSCAGARAEVVAEHYAIGIGGDRATAAVDTALSAAPDSVQTPNDGQGAVAAIAVPAGGTLGEYCRALDRLRERLPGTRVVADFVGKEARDGFEVAIIVTRPIH